MQGSVVSGFVKCIATTVLHRGSSKGRANGAQFRGHSERSRSRLHSYYPGSKFRESRVRHIDVRADFCNGELQFATYVDGRRN